MRIRNGIFAVSAVGLFIGMVQGCATEVVVVDEEDGSVITPTDASKPDSNTKPDSNVPDSAKPDSAKPDTSTPDSTVVDASDSGLGPRPGDPFDPLAPKTGDTCPTGVMENDIITRNCGFCGKQNALCEAGRKVGTYGACTNESTAAARCLPNERIVTACGFCGVQYKNCDNTCTYIEGACQNQVVNGCTANEVVYLEGVCAVATDVRRQVCSATCSKGAPEACAPRPLDEITVSQTAGTTITGNFQTTGSLKLPLLTGSSCPATESGTTSSLFHYVRIKNTGADEVTISVTNGIPAGSTRPLVTLAAYPAAAVAAIPTDRKLCAGALAQSSPEKLTLTIPANSSVIVHTMMDSASATQAKLSLEVRTNFVGPETPPAPQYMIDMGAANGDIVNQAIAFDAANTLPRPTGLLGELPCPLTLSSSDTSYSYIRVNNPGATARTATIATTGGTDTVLAYYNGMAPISTGRLACTGNWVEDFIDESLAGVTIPAMGYITVYVGRYSGTGGTSNLRVTTSN